MSRKEKMCPGCGRIYEPTDWDGPDCPFCGTLLTEGENNLLSDVISTNVVWPAGQKPSRVTAVSGYMPAQLLKAQLESAGIPVYLEWEGAIAVGVGTFGTMLEVKVFVPENRAAEALSILQFATVHFYNQSNEKGIKATGIGIE